MWNDKVHTPISYPNEVIHDHASNKIGGKFGLTCSTFVGMVMASWKYGDTTYVKDSNHKAHNWGTDFAVPGSLPKNHIGAGQLLKYLYTTDRTAFHKPGKIDYQVGDIIFFQSGQVQRQHDFHECLPCWHLCRGWKNYALCRCLS